MKREMKVSISMETVGDDRVEITAKQARYSSAETLVLNREEAEVLVTWLGAWLEQPTLNLVDVAEAKAQQEMRQ